jgi:hypothetical protein
MITLDKTLKYLGFNDDDYVLQNDLDERGDYIRDWFSQLPQPTEEEINQSGPDAEIYFEQLVETQKQLRTSVINKISATLTSEEKAWLEENL